MPNFNILLLSTYEMGRQPFGLASPAAWLRAAGFGVQSLDLSLEPLRPEPVKAADLVAFYLPMHMATRLMIPVIKQVQQLNPKAYLCCFGLYAPVNELYLRTLGIDFIVGGEFEGELVKIANSLHEARSGGRTDESFSTSLISLARQNFLRPSRLDLPPLSQYAHLVTAERGEQVAGYTETSRGCKHLCRHCPIVPVYGGRFRVVQREVVLADIRQQIAAGARHITFGDPDFFNGPGHTLPIVTALHDEFPEVTYDVTIKVEHLLKYARHLRTLKETGCLFITTAVESFDEETLIIFDKRHTKAEFETALARCRELGLLVAPTFVAFTPWTTLANYRHFLAEIARLGLIEQVAPIQYTLRLLIPSGSRLLELAQVRAVIGEFDQAKLSYAWQNADPRVERLQQALERLVYQAAAGQRPRTEIFGQIWQRAHQDTAKPPPIPAWPSSQEFVPYLTEPWYC